jgi:hypothetical protein
MFFLSFHLKVWNSEPNFMKSLIFTRSSLGRLDSLLNSSKAVNSFNVTASLNKAYLDSILLSIDDKLPMINE